MPSKRDYYEVLEVTRGAGEAEIKKAYRRLAFQWHPDRNPGRADAAERFKEISEAYAVLIDPAKRRQYDQARQAGRPGEFSYSQQDIFRDLFSNAAASSIFEELAREFERMGMHVDRRYFQQTLFGGRAVVTGGIFVISPLTPLIGAFRLARAALRGAHTARAVGFPQSPKGGLLARIGHRLGQWLLGAAGGQELPRVQQSEDLTMPLPLTPPEAEQGGPKRVCIQGVAGPEEVLVNIPPGVHNGTRLRLRGKGLVRSDGSRGDAYLIVEVPGSVV